MTGPSPARPPDVRRLIRLQLNRSGNILLAALEPLSDEELYAETAHGVSAAWTVGHLACVSDLFVSWVAGEDKRIPASTHAIFNPLDLTPSELSKAARVDPQAFDKRTIIGLFRRAQIHTLAVLDRFDIGRWAEPTPPRVPDNLPTWGSIWEALGVHTYWHLGELAGSLPRFFGTYTLNTVLHYFYLPPDARTP